MKKMSKFKLLRYGFSGSIVGIALAGVMWHGDITAEYLLAIIGFGIAYLTVREM